MNEKIEREIHEVLETLWVYIEELKNFGAEDKVKMNGDSINALEEIKRRGWTEEKGGNIVLTDTGLAQAQKVIRRHRLAEVLFVDLFNIKDDIIEEVGCTFEHILDEDVVDRVCSFLSHPPACPHGKKIPQGKCCNKFEKKVLPVVQRLWDINPGETAKIVFITSDTKTKLDKLFSLNVVPGKELKFIQKFPSAVIKIGETSVAMDEEIAREIFVIPKWID